VKQKIVFIIVASSEAELVHPFYQNLVQRQDTDVLNIHTDLLCCEKGTRAAEQALQELGMHYKALSGYKVKNIVEVIKYEKPDVVVVGSDQEYIRRSFLLAAEGLGIPTLLLQLGFGSNVANNIISIAIGRTVYRLTHYLTNIIKKYTHLLKVVIALRWSLVRIIRMIYKDLSTAFIKDSVCGEFGERPIVVTCEWEKGILLERGIKPNFISVTGSPKFEAVAQERGVQDRENMRYELGFGSKDKAILLLTCAQVEHGRWTYNQRSRFINGVIDAVSPLLSESVHLVIKIHPTENIEEYRELIANRKEPIKLSRDFNLSSIIQASDVVLVGGYSTTVLVVAGLCKPVLILNVFGEIEEIPFVDMGLAIEINDMSIVQSVVEELLYNQAAREKLLNKAKPFFTSNKELVDGKATERIADIIMGLANSHRRS